MSYEDLKKLERRLEKLIPSADLDVALPPGMREQLRELIEKSLGAEAVKLEVEPRLVEVSHSGLLGTFTCIFSPWTIVISGKVDL